MNSLNTKIKEIIEFIKSIKTNSIFVLCTPSFYKKLCKHPKIKEQKLSLLNKKQYRKYISMRKKK